MKLHIGVAYNLDSIEKILILFDNDENFDKQEYSKIVKVQFTKERSDVYYETSDFKNFVYKLKLPGRVLYGNKNYEDFITEFKEMEVQKIINMVKVTERDIVEIKNPS